jgi:hypothetical protein
MRRYLLILMALLVPTQLPAQSDPRGGCDNFQGQAMAGDVAGLEQALALGADIECRQSIYEDATAVILAARGGHADAVRLLLQRGANVHARDGSGWTALRHARQVYGALPKGTLISRNLELVIEALRSANAQE